MCPQTRARAILAPEPGKTPSGLGQTLARTGLLPSGIAFGGQSHFKNPTKGDPPDANCEFPEEPRQNTATGAEKHSKIPTKTRLHH